MSEQGFIGRHLAGTYEVLEEIGRGAMGVVYRARHLHLSHEAAVKVLRRELVDDPEALARFRREAQVLMGITHENVVPIRLYGVDEGRPFLVMDLCEGATLGELLLSQARLEEERAVAITRQILAALGAAHAAGVVHRDLKPANVMIEADDRVRVLDFGLSRLGATDSGAPQEALLTRAGDLLGTIAYMAPEQTRGEVEITPQADLFAVGVMLHEMLAGELPFQGDSLISLIKEISTRAVRPLEDASPPVRDAVAKALAKPPAARFASAAEFSKALAPAAPAPTPRRGPMIAVLIATAVIAALVTGLVLSDSDEDTDLDAVRTEARAALAGCATHEALASTRRLVAGDAKAVADEDLVLHATASAASGDPDAERALERAISRVGPRPDLVALRAEHTWFELGNLAAALRFVREGLTASPNSPELLRARIRILLDAHHREHPDTKRPGLLAGLRDDAENIPHDGPHEALALVLRSFVASRQALLAAQDGERAGPLIERAEADALRAQELRSTWAAPRLAMAIATSIRSSEAKRSGDHESRRAFLLQEVRALTDALELVEQHPAENCGTIVDRSAMYRHRGLSRRELGTYDEALADIRIHYELDGGTEARYYLSLLLRENGLLDEAISHLEAMIPIARDRVHYFDLAFCHQQLAQDAILNDEPQVAVDELGLAIEGYANAIDVDPSGSSPYAYRGQCRVLRATLAPDRAAEEMQRARIDFETAERLDLEEHGRQTAGGEVALRYSAMLVRDGQVDRAIAMLEGAVGSRKDETPSTYAQLGRLYLAQAASRARSGERAKADQSLDNAEERHAQIPRVEAYTQLLALGADADTALVRALVSEGATRRAALATWRGITIRKLDLLEGLEGQYPRYLEREARIRQSFVALLEADEEQHIDLADALLDEFALGRFHPRAAWLDALADALEASGKTAAANTARHVASRRQI